MGWLAARIREADVQAMNGRLPENFRAGFPSCAREATTKDYGVIVAKPQGYSRAPHHSIGQQ